MGEPPSPDEADLMVRSVTLISAVTDLPLVSTPYPRGPSPALRPTRQGPLSTRDRGGRSVHTISAGKAYGARPSSGLPNDESNPRRPGRPLVLARKLSRNRD